MFKRSCRDFVFHIHSRALSTLDHLLCLPPSTFRNSSLNYIPRTTSRHETDASRDAIMRPAQSNDPIISITCLTIPQSPLSVFFPPAGKQCPGDTRSAQSATDSSSPRLAVCHQRPGRSTAAAPARHHRVHLATGSRSAWTGVRVGAAWLSPPVVAGPVRRCCCWTAAASHLLAASVIVAEMRSAAIGGAIVLAQLLTATLVLAGGGKPNRP